MASLSEVQFAKIDAAATATIVAAQAAGVKIRVVALFLVNTSAQTVAFNSAASGTALTGAMALPANGSLVLPFNNQGWFQTAAAALLEMALSGTTQVSGAIAWVAVG